MSELILGSNQVKPSSGLKRRIFAASNFREFWWFNIQIPLLQLSAALDVIFCCYKQNLSRGSEISTPSLH
jgi:hypothetical protein